MERTPELDVELCRLITMGYDSLRLKLNLNPIAKISFQIPNIFFTDSVDDAWIVMDNVDETINIRMSNDEPCYFGWNVNKCLYIRSYIDDESAGDTLTNALITLHKYLPLKKCFCGEFCKNDRVHCYRCRRNINLSCECAICRDYESKTQITRLRCGHIYHKTCIEAWATINSTCPICRAHI
jgi:hypothetical protein